MSSSSPLEAFKEALREEYARRYDEEVKAIENRLGDAIARRRREVEKEVSQMRLLQQEALQLRKDEIRSRVFYELTEYLYALGQELSEKVRQEVRARVASLRDQGSLQFMEKELFHEALEPFEEGRVILSCLPGTPEGLRSHPRVAECLFFEEEEDVWGGCVLVDEATRTLVVDNRLSTRWNKVRHGLAKKIGSTMEELFDQVLRTVRELRIS